MNNKYNLQEFVPIVTCQSVMIGLRDRFVERRKEQKISQIELSNLSGVSYASIRRFEKTCEISLSSLVDIAKAINCLEDFDELFTTPKIKNLRDYKV